MLSSIESLFFVGVMRFKTFLLFLMFSFFTNAQVVKKGKIKLNDSIILDDKLKETSGLIHWDGKLWTHNDDTDVNLYELDTVTGKIIDTYALQGVSNNDWEEITQDEEYLYIGDFGNNASGNRKNLNILKIEKQSLLFKRPTIESIKFTYENQSDFLKNKPNTTNFDCEAFIVVQDSLFLFTKEWKSKKTTVYKLPNRVGDFVAEKGKSYNIKGLVTGACYYPLKKILVLCGYTRKGKPFIELFFDFEGNDFFSGSKKRIKLKPRFMQIEAISTNDGVHYYLTNEKLKFGPIDTFQQMHILDLGQFIKSN